MVCFDTSILIDYLKGDEGIVELIKAYAKDEKISTTAITEYELLKHPDRIKRDVAMELISSMEVHSFDTDAAVESAKIYQDLKARGKMINENDILIAGISESNKELLITRDTGFSDISESGRVRIV